MSTLDELIAALDHSSGPTTTTSVRQPASLRTALQIAVGLGLAENANDATNEALRAQLNAFAQGLALDEHFATYPWARPTLNETAQALAILDHSPLVEHPELIEQAASEITEHRPEADAEDVLLWAESLLRHRRSRRPRAS